MARAAVKAKQQAKKAQAQPAKPRRGRRSRHSGGGNPNQQLFFMKLRRGQRWLYALLAVVFGITFAGVGVGSGNSGGLSQLYTGLFGSGGNAVSKAQGEIKKTPAKGYRDLATAYETTGDTVQAMTALQSYLGLKKKDANAWAELGGLNLSQARTYATQYQAAQQAAQLADPSSAFVPGGTLATAVGSNPAYQGAAQQASTQTSQLYQQATTSLTSAVTDYQTVTKLQPRSATAWQQLATGAENAGNFKVALGAWHKYLKLYPNSPERAAVKGHIKRLEQAAHPSTPTVKTGKK